MQPDYANKPRAILVVDDDPDIRDLVQVSLTSEGHVVHVFASASEALDKAELLNPDLIITDVMMPELDGWGFVRALRSRPATVLTPVIFLTALRSSEDRLRGFRLGADDYLPKPFEPEELVLRVRRVLRDRVDLRAEAALISQPDLEGRLERIGLPAVLIMFEVEQKSGKLTLRSEDRHCTIWLRRGSPVEASLHTGLRGSEAVFQALEWSEGAFGFCEEVVQVEDTVGMGTTQLLLEGARRMDEAARVREGA